MVLIVLMPQHSTLQRRIPEQALDALNGPLRRAFGTDMPIVLDLQRSVGDEGLVDLAHLNTQGRAEFSRLLGDEVRRRLPHGRSLMRETASRGTFSPGA